MPAHKPVVILIHGLWMSPIYMKWLGAQLKKAGYHPEYFAYPTVRKDYEKQVLRLRENVEQYVDPVCIVGHSLGGLLAIDALQGLSVANRFKLVLLGSPVAGSQVARSLYKHSFGRLILGSGGFRLTQVTKDLPPEVHILSIAGTKPLGLSRILPGRANIKGDGAVALSEALPSNYETDSIQVSVNHIGLVFSPCVVTHIVDYLNR